MISQSIKQYLNKFNILINKYLVFIIFFFGLLSLLPNIICFKSLSVSTTAGIIYRAIIFGIILILFLFVLLLNKKRPNKYILIACSIYLITNIISIFISPVIKNIEVPLLQQFVGLSVIAGNIITVFLSFFLLNSYESNKKYIDILTYILIAVGVILCLYTYIFEYQDIINTFTKEYGWNYDVTSIFVEKTTYGYCLLFISIYTIIYSLTRKKYWFYLFVVFFLLNSVIARTKTTVLCLSILLIGVLIYHIINSWNNYKKRWIIALSISLSLILIFLILTIAEVGFFGTINRFISEVIIGDGIVVVKDRLSKLGNIFSSVNYPLGILFGCGERITNYIIAPAKICGDNIYASVYATGGIVKSVLYILLIVYIFYKYIKNENTKSIKFMQCLILSVFLIAGLFEDDSLIGLNSTYLFITVAIFGSNSLFKKEANY